MTDGVVPGTERPWRGAAATARIFQCLQRLRVDRVLDVGANHGEFTGQALASLPNPETRVVAVDADPRVLGHLRERTSDDPRAVNVHAAVAGQSGRQSVNLARNAKGTSLLRPSAEGRRRWADLVTVGTADVAVITGAALIRAHSSASSRWFVKVDTQGNEDEVLSSFLGVEDRIVGGLVEGSLQPLYEAETSSVDRVLEACRSLGLTCAEVFPVARDAEGALLAVDLLVIASGELRAVR